MNELVKNFEDTLVSDREFSHQLNQDVLTELFVESFSKLLPVIRHLGKAFYFVEKDVTSKLNIIQKNKTKFNVCIVPTFHYDGMTFFKGANADLLLELMFHEFQTKSKSGLKHKNGTCRNVLRLKRALHFIEVFLARLDNIDQDLMIAAKESYAEALYNYHSWAARSAVSVALYTLPTRSKFLGSLGLDPFQPDLFNPLVEATKNVRIAMNQFYDKYDLGSI